MALNFIQKKGIGGVGRINADVSVNATGEKYGTISFNEDALKTINPSCDLPKGLMVGVQDSRIYFVPTNKNSSVAFVVNQSVKKSRPTIKISKRYANLAKFEGRYNFHYDEKEGAYYIDRKFILD